MYDAASLSGDAVPVTAKLSRKFYERLGEEIANELVEWFNTVDATYRADLREFNELNFARFDAKLEQRLAEHSARLEARMQGLESRMEGRMSGLEARMEGRMSGLAARMEGLATKAELQVLREEVINLKAELIRWMFLFWAGTALAGLLTR